MREDVFFGPSAKYLSTSLSVNPIGRVPASLDVENETKIQAGISELIKHKTVLIIAHRMRTIAHADKIVVLKDGHVAETGNPEELKKQNGLFCQMMKRQVVRA